MNDIEGLLANNESFAGSVSAVHLDVRPTRRLAIVTCMDSRLDVFAALGLGAGEAHVLRNAGGVITDDMIRSLTVSQRHLGTRGVMLIQHTDCGMQSITDDDFRAELQDATGVAPAFAIESFSDLEANVRQSILRIRHSPFLMHTGAVRGFVYDVDTHRLQARPLLEQERRGAGDDRRRHAGARTIEVGIVRDTCDVLLREIER